MAGVICESRIPARVKGKVLQEGSQSSYVIWAEGGGTDEKDRRGRS